MPSTSSHIFFTCVTGLTPLINLPTARENSSGTRSNNGGSPLTIASAWLCMSVRMWSTAVTLNTNSASLRGAFIIWRECLYFGAKPKSTESTVDMSKIDKFYVERP